MSGTSAYKVSGSQFKKEIFHLNGKSNKVEKSKAKVKFLESCLSSQVIPNKCIVKVSKKNLSSQTLNENREKHIKAASLSELALAIEDEKGNSKKLISELRELKEKLLTSIPLEDLDKVTIHF